MYYREVEVLRMESIAAAGTRTLDINITDPISKLSVVWRKKNSNYTIVNHPADIVKSIIVCDGADVLFAMDGSHAQSMAYFTDNRQPASIINYESGEYSVQMAELKFGRWLYDEILALDPKRFNNLQIKIEHDLALGGCAGSVADLSVYAHCFDEKVIEPVGWLYNKEIYTFLPVAATWYYVDIPTDYPVRALMFGSSQATEGPNFVFEEFKLTENQGKHILVESRVHRYMYQSTAHQDPWNERVSGKTTGADAKLEMPVTPHFEREAACTCSGATAACRNANTAGSRVHVYSAGGAEEVSGPVRGHSPFGDIFLKTFGGEKVEDCWQIPYAGSGRLEIMAMTGLAAQGAKYAKVYTQQVRTY